MHQHDNLLVYIHLSLMAPFHGLSSPFNFSKKYLEAARPPLSFHTLPSPPQGVSVAPLSLSHLISPVAGCQEQAGTTKDIQSP